MRREYTPRELAAAEAELAPFVNPHVSAERQTAAAIEHLYRDAEDFVRWPYPELDELTGPLGCGGDIWFVAAFSGSGKTTFITSCILAWMAAGKKVYAMPLETEASRFRTYLAGMMCGIDPGAVISGDAYAWPNWPKLRERMVEAYRSLQKAAPQLMISEQSAIDVRGMNDAMAEACGFGADIVIIDHIDHIEGAAGKSAAEQSAEVNHAALEIVKANQMLLVSTSQLNMDALKNSRDKLAKFQPPSLNQLWIPSKKTHVATGIIGLHRKLREQGPNETPDDYQAALKAARDGSAEPQTMLDPGVMAVNAMKLRNKGSNDGKRAHLGFESGRVVTLAEKDRFATGFGGRIRRVV